jgi:hypothetical protein
MHKGEDAVKQLNNEEFMNVEHVEIDVSNSYSVATAAGNIVKHAILDKDGPTGQFISYDNNPDTGRSPW